MSLIRISRRPLSFLIVLAALAGLLATSAIASLDVYSPDPSKAVTFYGHGGYSSDGLGQNSAGGHLQARVPAGSSVFAARLYGTYEFNAVVDETARTISFDGASVVLSLMTQNEHASIKSAVADVTSIVAEKVGPGGGCDGEICDEMYDFRVGNDPAGLDGVALVVVYSNPDLPLVSIAVMEGGLDSAGQTTVLHFSEAVSKGEGFHAEMALGIGYSYQGGSGAGNHTCGAVDQRSIIITNPSTGSGTRLTSCAGNYDDGVGNNGGLITVGGVGDSAANPADPFSTTSPSGDDDELYNISSFITDGATSFGIRNYNPSGDDNVFLAVVSVTARLRIGTGPRLTVDQRYIPASPSSIPLAGIRTQPSSPVGSALLGGSVIGSPLLGGSVIGSPLVGGSVIGSPLLGGSVIGSPLLGGSVIGSPLPAAALEAVPLSSLPLDNSRFPGGWNWVLEPTVLNGVPLPSITLKQVLSLTPSPARLSQLTWGDIDWTSTPIGSMSMTSIAMGEVALRDFTFPAGSTPVCVVFETNGFGNCGSGFGGTSATFMGLELGGLSPDKFHTAGIPLSNINLTKAGFLKVSLTSVRDKIGLPNTPIGTIRLNELPDRAAVVDCSGCADTSTLAENASSLVATATVEKLGTTINGRWVPIARLAALPLAEMLYSFVSLADNPYESMSLAQMVAGYAGPEASVLHYRFAYVYQGTSPVDMPTVSVTLPESFAYLGGSSVLKTALTPSGTPIPDPSINGAILSWSLNGTTLNAGDEIKVEFAASPGFELGTFHASAGIVGTGLSEHSDLQAPVTVTENFEPNGSPSSATPMVKDKLYLAHNAQPLDVDYFSFAPPSDPAGVPVPGTKIDFFVGHLSHNATVVVYLPPGAHARDLRGAPLLGGSVIGSPLIGGSVIGSPLVGGSVIGSPVEDDGLEADNNDEAVDPLLTEDIPILQDRQVAAISAAPGLETEVVSITVPEGLPAGSKLLVQVSGQLGDTSPVAYSIRAKEVGAMTPPPCAPRTFSFPTEVPSTQPAWIGNVPADRKTLFIVNSHRMAKSYGANEAAKVQAALSSTFLDRPDVMGAVLEVGSVPAVAQSSGSWDADPCSVAGAKEYVRQINLAVNSALQTNKPAIEFITVVGTDEIIPFGRVKDFTDIVNEKQYIQDLAFTLNLPGQPARNNALFAAAFGGYILTDDVFGDFQPEVFLTDALYRADVATSRLVETPQQIADQITRFISFNGMLDPTTALTVGYDFNSDMANDLDDDLDSRLSAANASDLVSDNWNSQQLKNLFTNAPVAPDLVFPQGHANHFALLGASGNTTGDLSDTFLSSDVTNGTSLTGLMIASIGCHLGYSVSDVMLGNSAPMSAAQARQFNDFAQAFAGKGAASLSANTGTGYGDINTIAFSERLTLLYGKYLRAGEVSGKAFNQAKHDYFSQLGALSVFDAKALQEFTHYGILNYRLQGTSTPAPAPAPVTLGSDPTGTTSLQTASIDFQNTFTQKNGPDGNHFVIGDIMPQVTNYRPITAITGRDITVSGLEPSGAIITGLGSTDINNFDPAISIPVEDRTAIRPEPQFDGAFPSRLQAITSYLSGGQRRYRLNVMATQFRSTGMVGASQKGTMRKFNDIDVQVFFADPARTDRLAPVIRTVEGSKIDANTLQVAVRLTDETPGTPDIAGGLLIYKDGTSWKSAPFAGGSNDLWTVHAPLGSSVTEYFVQFWDRLGNTAVASNGGGNFGDASPPKVSILSPQENARFKLNQVVYASYSCTDIGSGVADGSCAGDVPVGAQIDTSKPGLNKFTVMAVDRSGNVVSEERTYFVDYVFIGFKAPLKNTDTASGEMNAANAGRAIPLKWELRDYNGKQVTDLGATQVALSWRLISCGTRGETSLDIPITTISAPFTYDPVSKQYTWIIDTPKDPSWPGTCRRLIATFNGTETHFVDFSFR